MSCEALDLDFGFEGHCEICGEWCDELLQATSINNDRTILHCYKYSCDDAARARVHKNEAD